MKIEDFVEEMRGKAEKGLLEVSRGGKSTEKTYQFQVGSGCIKIVRGGIIEKAAISHLIFKNIKPPGAVEESDGMVYQMEVFPENPYCPMGHFSTQWTMGKTNEYSMNLDLFPAVRVEEDLDAMRYIMDKVADRFGKDKSKFREGQDIQYNMEHWSFPLATKVGCKLMQLKEEDLVLFITAYHTFFDAYLTILRKRKDTKFTEEEVTLKHERNGKWLEYLTFKDRAVKMAQAYSVPAELLIGLGFPPTAVFK
jgi:coproporphyrinogen III oxidase